MEMDSSPSVHQDHNHFEAPNPASLLPFATSAVTVGSPSSSSAAAGSASSPDATVSRYENQKRRDWNTFGQYLRNHRPPLSLSQCSGAHVLEFLRYLDQFGKTKVHTQFCPFFGHPNLPGPCACPLRQAWGSLDALIGRLSAAFEEHGGKPENNPFGAWAVRLYLREARDSQSKARGISYEKERKGPQPQQQELELQQQHHQMARPSSPPRKHSTTASGSSSSSSSSITSEILRLFGVPMVTGEYDVPSFLFKLYELVDDRDTDGVISWNDAGSGFIIHQPSLFEKELLRENFHTLSAFVHHLTTVHGFVKAGGDQWEFSRIDFGRGRPIDAHDLITSWKADPIVYVDKSSMMVEEVEKELMFDKVVTPSDVGMLTRPSSPPGKPSTASGSSSSSLTSGSRRLLGDPMFMGAYKTYLFLCKLYELVDDWDTDGVISWNDAGSGFIIHQPSLFEKELLTKIFFNCHTLSAFVRHLTTVLGFVEAGGGDQLEFSRNDFRRGRRPLFDVHDLVTSRNADPMGGADVSSVTVEEEEKELMFDMVVTPSDVGKLNRLVIPKHHAEKYFPLRDLPSDEEKGLDFRDGNGKPWSFLYSYCNSSQCYVMTKGWSQFVKEKNLDAGDILSFQRGAGEDSCHHLFIDLKRCPTIGTHPYSPMAIHLNLNTSLQPVSEPSCVTTEADKLETTYEENNLTFHASEEELYIRRTRKLSLARFLQKRADRLRSEERSAVGEDDEEQQLDHRSSTFSSVMDDALKGDSPQNVCSSLEPMLRQLVREEVHHDLSKQGLVPLARRSSANRIEGSDGRNLQLHFRTNLSRTVFTGIKVEGEQGAAVDVVLLDANSGHVVTSGPESSIKLDVVPLDGDFQYDDDDDDWTQKEFQTHIVYEREGRRPLLTGDTQVTLKEGVGTLGDLAFTDNSSWIRSGKLRLGLKVASAVFEGIRIREAKSEAFRVKDHRNESYKTHFPPLPPVQRLLEIAKGGVFHNRLTYGGHHSHPKPMPEKVPDQKTSLQSGSEQSCVTTEADEIKTAYNKDKYRSLSSDDQILQLVVDLESESIDEQMSAAMEIRLLAKNRPENRLKIAKAGAIKPLVAIISSSDLNLQENGVTALLNLSLCDENKVAIASSGVIKPLVQALKTGTPTTRGNAACALLRLSQFEENKLAIGRSGAIAPLVDLLESDGIRGKKDAATALYSLCSAKENKVRAVQAGVMKPLVELMADLGSRMVDKAAFVLTGLVSVPEARVELVKEAGIPVLVEIVEVGTHRQKEIAVAVLLQVCEESAVFRDMVAREGAIPPVVALSQSAATSRSTKQKAETLVELLRQPRSGKPAARASEVSGLTNIEEVHGVHTVGCAGRKDRHSNNWTVKGDQDHPIPLSVHADFLTRILGMRKLKVHNLFGEVPKSLPSIFQANSFVELHLPCYNHRLLWAGKLALVNLRLINLKHSSKLISLPDLSMAQKIVHLNLRGCVKLIQVSYIRNLTKLEKLNLSYCGNIKVLPSLIGLQNLKEFYLSGCSNLWNLPPSIIALNSLVVLDLKNCAQLCELPRITSGLRSLQKLNISGCTNILRSLDMKGTRESQLLYGRFLSSTISGTYRHERASQFVEEATSLEQKKSTTKKAKKISAPEVVQVETTVEKELTIKNFNWKAKMEKEERKRKSVESATTTCKEVRVKRIGNYSDDFVSSICQPSHEAVEEAILDSGSKVIDDTEPALPGRSPNLKENTLAGLAIEDPTSGEGEDVGLGIQMEPEVISLCNSSDHPRKECSERVQLDVSKTAAPCGPHKFAEKSCDGGLESNTEMFSHQTIETEPLSSYEENDEIDWLKNEIQKLQEQLEASEKRRDGFRECYDSLESELWPLCAELEVEHVNLKEQKQKHEESELEASNAWEDLKNLIAETIF